MFERRLRAKSPEQVRTMRRAGRLVGRTLELVAAQARPGVTLLELDRLAEDHIRSYDGVPSFKGYHGFPASICASVNEQVVHGIPSERVLRAGDMVSIDCGAIVDGWHGDAAVTVIVGAAGPGADDAGSDDAGSAADRDLSAACEASMWAGIAAMVAGGRLSDIGAAVEASVRAAGRYGIVEDYTGHGIGTRMHEDPNVPNYGRPGRGPKLVVGAVLAIEPMITAGTADVAEQADGWTVVTADGGKAAHWEHTVAVTENGPWVLTAIDGGRSGLASIGAPCGAEPE